MEYIIVSFAGRACPNMGQRIVKPFHVFEIAQKNFVIDVGSLFAGVEEINAIQISDINSSAKVYSLKKVFLKVF